MDLLSDAAGEKETKGYSSMKILSVNIGNEQLLQVDDHLYKTGIYKLPVDGSMEVTENGLTKDYIFSSLHHGGPDQAVYIYGSYDYDWWNAELGRELFSGTFGENLTIQGLESAAFCVGDRLEIGQVILEITAPRIPCWTLAARMDDSEFIGRYRNAERPGLYCRVIRSGTLQAKQQVVLHKFQGEQVTILELFRGFYDLKISKVEVQRQLQAPVAIRVRDELEKVLARFSGSNGN